MEHRITDGLTQTSNVSLYFWCCTILPCGDSPVGPASQPVGTWQLTCDKSQLPFGPVINVCCDNLAVSLVSRKPDDPLIVSENDFITKFACREVSNSI
ncbi:hypothetical protein PSHT_07854 [Puccinia striiformis]|uniref:Uncharacterized protein n=1 Tax=Puccinia striiformis TaxID=27350 RepID=A0A2S4VUC2_9BASI|nr:hypothetical protein PSHT_07854 [Puccinia striiformis]